MSVYKELQDEIKPIRCEICGSYGGFNNPIFDVSDFYVDSHICQECLENMDE